MPKGIDVRGLAEFSRALKKMDSEIPKQLRVKMNDAVQVVADSARHKVRRRSGKAAGSIKTSSTQNKARIRGGGNRAPYYPWLDFGGRVGKKRSVKRPFIKSGRYLWKSFGEHHDEVVKGLEQAITDAARQAGLEVTHG